MEGLGNSIIIDECLTLLKPSSENVVQGRDPGLPAGAHSLLLHQQLRGGGCNC